MARIGAPMAGPGGLFGALYQGAPIPGPAGLSLFERAAGDIENDGLARPLGSLVHRPGNAAAGGGLWVKFGDADTAWARVVGGGGSADIGDVGENQVARGKAGGGLEGSSALTLVVTGSTPVLKVEGSGTVAATIKAVTTGSANVNLDAIANGNAQFAFLANGSQKAAIGYADAAVATYFWHNGNFRARMTATGFALSPVATFAPAARLHVADDVANTATVFELIREQLSTTGTAAAGFGKRRTHYLEDAAGNLDLAAAEDVVWNAAASGGESARRDLYLQGAAGNGSQFLRLLSWGARETIGGSLADRNVALFGQADGTEHGHLFYGDGGSGHLIQGAITFAPESTEGTSEAGPLRYRSAGTVGNGPEHRFLGWSNDNCRVSVPGTGNVLFLGGLGASLGVLGATPVARQSITGSTDSAKIASIIAALVAFGFATDSTT